jgi:hypothetical protein
VDPRHGVAHLDETDHVEAVGQGLGQCPLHPAGVHLHDHPHAELAGEVDDVTQTVDEADVGPQLVGVLDEHRDRRLVEDGLEHLAQGVGGLFPAEVPGGTGRDHHRLRSDRVRLGEHGAQVGARRRPRRGVTELGAEAEEARHLQPGPGDDPDAVPGELATGDPHRGDPVARPEGDVLLDRKAGGADPAHRHAGRHDNWVTTIGW